MTIRILHNPRCSKSRKSLALLEANGVKPEIVRYLDKPPSSDEIVRLAELVGVPVKDLLRQGEGDFRNHGQSLDLDDDQKLARWLHEHPRVLQRPIVVNDDSKRAVIGRPPENVLTILSP